MSSISRVVLGAGAASLVGDVIDCTGVTHLHLYVSVVGTAVTGSVIFGTTPDGSNLATCPVMLAPGVTETLITTGSSGFAMNATTVQVDLTAAGAGNIAIRISSPPQYVVPRFAYTSGGDATTIVAVRAYGYNVKP